MSYGFIVILVGMIVYFIYGVVLWCPPSRTNVRAPRCRVLQYVHGLLIVSVAGDDSSPMRESWIRGSSDSRTIYFSRTIGLWRYKIEDFVPCPDGTLLGVEGKLGYTDM